MAKIGLIISSTRPNRFADHPTKWIADKLARRDGVEFEVLDLRDYPMPFFNEVASPLWGPSQNPVAQEWQRKVDAMDAYIVVTAEYNRGPTAAIKNAFDYAYREWNKKPIAFVGYGSTGGARAIDQLRQNAIELQMAPIRIGVHIMGPAYMAVASGQQTLADIEPLNKQADDMLNMLSWWTAALKAARDNDVVLAREKAA